MSIIRKADRSDARQLSEVAERTFRETFGALNAAEDMDLHCRTSYGERIQAAEISSPNMITLLSDVEERLVGFAQLRWGSAPACVLADAPGEVQRLYVVNDWQGKGIAQDLMNTCIEEMKAHGSDVVWLGVWERNQRAMAFYRKFGFAEVGAHVFRLGRDPQRDIVMARQVIGYER
jgi:ribosomal protein S18 acetylase RimI-like enzyme